MTTTNLTGIDASWDIREYEEHAVEIIREIMKAKGYSLSIRKDNDYTSRPIDGFMLTMKGEKEFRYKCDTRGYVQKPLGMIADPDRSTPPFGFDFELQIKSSVPSSRWSSGKRRTRWETVTDHGGVDVFTMPHSAVLIPMFAELRAQHIAEKNKAKLEAEARQRASVETQLWRSRNEEIEKLVRLIDEKMPSGPSDWENEIVTRAREILARVKAGLDSHDRSVEARRKLRAEDQS